MDIHADRGVTRKVAKRIVPYMTAKIPEELQLQSLMETKSWIEEFVSSEDDEDENDASGDPE